MIEQKGILCWDILYNNVELFKFMFTIIRQGNRFLPNSLQLLQTLIEFYITSRFLIKFRNTEYCGARKAFIYIILTIIFNSINGKVKLPNVLKGRKSLLSLCFLIITYILAPWSERRQLVFQIIRGKPDSEIHNIFLVFGSEFCISEKYFWIFLSSGGH